MRSHGARTCLRAQRSGPRIILGLVVLNLPSHAEMSTVTLQGVKRRVTGFKGIFFFQWLLTALTGPWPLLHFRNNFCTQSVRRLGRVIIPSQGRYLYTGQYKHRINAYTDIHALMGVRTPDFSVRASGDSSCLRQRGQAVP
jgi:hypothetical protein